jgi:hypothetical protein
VKHTIYALVNCKSQSNHLLIMRTSRSIELLSARSSGTGATFFSEPLASDETLIAEVRHSDHGELFCHRFQTDQLQVISGSLDLIVLQDRRLRCIHLRDDEPMWLRIPPESRTVPSTAVHVRPWW